MEPWPIAANGALADGELKADAASTNGSSADGELVSDGASVDGELAADGELANGAFGYDSICRMDVCGIDGRVR